jgi:BirA family biotin operon repressor/biotin-[acetyl-CoA-carboxylase] ligase
VQVENWEKYISEKLGKYKEFYNVTVEDEVTSTNSIMKENAENRCEGEVLVALSQTMGRGRMNRKFHSPANCGVYFSVVLKPNIEVKDSLSITTAAAVAVSMAVDKVAGIDTKIKWVNDIYYNQKKISGILTEASIDSNAGKLKYAVLGIGINICKPEEDYPEDIIDKAIWIFEKDVDYKLKCNLIVEVLKKFYDIYKEISNKSHMDIYRKKCFLIGKEIEYIIDNEKHMGTVIEIDNDARLVVEGEFGQMHTVCSGEINLVRF